jgi:HD-like signal output (HDOD) protein
VSQTADIASVIERMPPLPDVALQVLAIVKNPEYQMDELVSVVRTDPSLTARILKLCNSSLFSLKFEITTVTEALSFLGTRNILQIVISTCTRSFFKKNSHSSFLNPESIWRHSVACAIGCQILADHLHLYSIGTPFTAGILHNIGKVALAQLLDAADIGPLTLPDGTDESYLGYERRLLGFDHAAAAALATKRWPLPSEIRRAITNHHDPAKISTDPELTSIVHVADILCLQAGIGAPCGGLVYEVSTAARDRLRLTDGDLDLAQRRMLQEFARASELSQLAPT